MIVFYCDHCILKKMTVITDSFLTYFFHTYWALWHLIHVIHWLKISNSYLYVVQSHRYSQNSQSRCKGFSKEWFLWIMLLWINGTVQLHILTKYGFHSHANFTTRIPETFYFLLHYSENLYDSVYIYIYIFFFCQSKKTV